MKKVYLKDYVNVDTEVQWYRTMQDKHMSGHLYRNSPFETDNSCGNCNGARCETCIAIPDPPHWEASLYSNIYYNALLKAGLPEDEASGIVYDDFYRSKVYRIIFPQIDDLKTVNLERYFRMTVLDYYLVQEWEAEKHEYECFHDLEQAAKEKHKDVPYIEHQLDLYRDIYFKKK